MSEADGEILSAAGSQPRPASIWVWIAVAAVLSIGVGIIPSAALTGYLWQNMIGGEAVMSLNLFAYLALLLTGLVLALSSPKDSGLVLGNIREHWIKVAIVCAVPFILMLLDDSKGENPFGKESYTMWLISPIAQDLIFIGFLYGQFDRVKPGMVHPKIPISYALMLTSFFFAIFHLPNLAAGMSVNFMIFQLLYTGIGLLIVGLARQWTGTILYVTLAHTLVNFTSWYMSG